MAVEALHKAALPFVAVLSDPTYGGVSASYAMQADVRMAIQGARIGFAGPQVRGNGKGEGGAVGEEERLNSPIILCPLFCFSDAIPISANLCLSNFIPVGQSANLPICQPVG